MLKHQGKMDGCMQVEKYKQNTRESPLSCNSANQLLYLNPNVIA